MALGEGKCTSEGITKVYAEWIKSYIPACDVTPATTQDCLRDGQILCKLIELTTGSPLVCNDQELNSTEASNLKVQTVLDFLEINGIDTKNISADDIAEGSLKETLDLLWIIILHFDVHTKNRAAYQRSVSMGKRFLLEWISRELPDTSIDTKGFFMDTLQSGSFLAKLIAKYCPLEEDVTSKEVLQANDLRKVFDVAQRNLGVPNILSASALLEGCADEYSLLIYLAILRRKICEGKGEEVFKGGTSPTKRAPPHTPDRTPVVTPVKLTPGKIMSHAPNAQITSPLSPNTLQSLVEQQAKSHEAIQSLQEKLQAVKYQPLTPKFKKKASQRRKSLERSPVKTEKDRSQQPDDMKTADCNANFLSAEEPSARRQIDQLYSAVDRRFLEFMLDAVHRGYLPAGFGASESVLSVPTSGKNEVKSKPSNVDANSNSDDTGLQSDPPTAIRGEKLAKEGNVDDALSKGRDSASENRHTTTTAKSSVTGEERGSSTNHKGENVTEQPKEELEMPSAEIPPGGSTVKGSSSHVEIEQDSTTASTSRLQSDSDLNSKSLSELTDVQDTQHIDSDSTGVKDKSQIEEEFYDTEEGLYDDDNDQFMMYLNSIEQTALKYKLQVEQAKIDTLQLLKERLEMAYEGTPLEQIPAKVEQKLHETIAEIASEEVQKYENLLKVEEDFDEAESDIILQMRTQLDMLAQENFRLQNELDAKRNYEEEYFELRQRMQEAEDEMASMKHEYATKTGESDFLSERIELLEKEILDMRVEYEGQIRELQNENLDLRKECLELDNENKILEDEVKQLSEGSTPEGNDLDIYGRSEKLCLDDEVPISSCELEAFETRLSDLERQNKALRTGASADQAMIQCLEGKINDIEAALEETKESNSSMLVELHEAQRQNSSDRAKIASYKEEIEALRHENKVLKGTLEITEGEVKYQREHTGRTPKGKRKEIWREIRELETILKDVHKEKRNIEKKYLAFQHENRELSRSLNSSRSPTGLSPNTSPNRGIGMLVVSPGKTRTASLLERVNNLLMKTSMPNGVKKELNSPVSSTESDGVPVYTDTPRSTSLSRDTKLGSPESDTGHVTSADDKKSSPTRSVTSGLSVQLDSLRKHVGDLEAEKASILKELNSIKASKGDSSS